MLRRFFGPYSALLSVLLDDGPPSGISGNATTPWYSREGVEMNVTRWRFSSKSMAMYGTSCSDASRTRAALKAIRTWVLLAGAVMLTAGDFGGERFAISTGLSPNEHDAGR